MSLRRQTGHVLAFPKAAAGENAKVPTCRGPADPGDDDVGEAGSAVGESEEPDPDGTSPPLAHLGYC